jgi:hypothetical protein
VRPVEANSRKYGCPLALFMLREVGKMFVCSEMSRVAFCVAVILMPMGLADLQQPGIMHSHATVQSVYNGCHI